MLRWGKSHSLCESASGMWRVALCWRRNKDMAKQSDGKKKGLLAKQHWELDNWTVTVHWTFWKHVNSYLNLGLFFFTSALLSSIFMFWIILCAYVQAYPPKVKIHFQIWPRVMKFGSVVARLAKCLRHFVDHEGFKGLMIESRIKHTTSSNNQYTVC